MKLHCITQRSLLGQIRAGHVYIRSTLDLRLFDCKNISKPVSKAAHRITSLAPFSYLAALARLTRAFSAGPMGDRGDKSDTVYAHSGGHSPRRRHPRERG